MIDVKNNRNIKFGEMINGSDDNIKLRKISDNIIDVLKLFQDIGWDIYDTQGMVF